MKVESKSTSNLTSLLILFMAFALSGCDSRSSSEYWSAQDIYCNSESISVIFERKRTIRGQAPLSHSSGYEISDRRNSWLVSWSLENGGVSANPNTCYLGNYVQERSSRGTVVTKQVGTPAIIMLAAGEPDLALIRGDQLTVLEHGVEKPPASIIQSDYNAGLNRYIFAANRKHVFSWQPDPAIFSIPDLKPVKKLADTKAFQKFTKQFKKRSNRKLFLTDDLKYLIAVPSNPTVPVLPEGVVINTFCYEIETDEFSTTILEGLDGGLIWAAHSHKDQIHWLIHHSTRGQWAIVDSKSNVIAEIPFEWTFIDGSVFWDPSRDVIWFVKLPTMFGDVKADGSGFTVIKIDIRVGTKVEFHVPFVELTVP